MEDISKEQLIDLYNTTVEWSSEVADLWTGTLYEKQINLSKERMLEDFDSNNTEALKDKITDLAQFLNKAEEEYRSTDER